MVTVHNLGFPRIGKQRELKTLLETYWKGGKSQDELLQAALKIYSKNLSDQGHLDWVQAGDFSLYDHMLDTSLLVGNLPDRAADEKSHWVDQYFRAARGRSVEHDCCSVRAGEMTKWLDTNYHYIVPEFSAQTQFSLNPEWLLTQIEEAKKLGKPIKPVVVGPLTYLYLGKVLDESSVLDLLDPLLAQYQALFLRLKQEGITWVQVDEPILVTELSETWKNAFQKAYSQLNTGSLNILLATYFDRLDSNADWICHLPVAGLHIDAVNAKSDLPAVLTLWPKEKVLSLGVVDGRNIWKTDLTAVLEWLEPVYEQRPDTLWLAPSCSLLHVPVDLLQEQDLDDDVYSWFAFAVQKLDEIRLLALVFNQGKAFVSAALKANADSIQNRKISSRIHNPAVKSAVASASYRHLGTRQSAFNIRKDSQQKTLNLPLFPTTTIGSFPQTATIRKKRLAYKKGEITTDRYVADIQYEIASCIREQEALGLDVLVHGEAERNDMVEYFGEQLDGFCFTRYGWVQSYGSRCVKPPIIVGDVSRPTPMTVQWSVFAQSLSTKPVKGMLTGPVTILNWSFVRDDQERSETCLQLALALREEVLDLEKAGITIIQIDEAALRERLPLRRADWKTYLNWAVESFRITANGVKDTTQIHTHMCYSEFNDIIEDIAKMDADVITIETSRSNMELLDAFETFNYPNDIGPGVYDIHSPNVPTVESMLALMVKATEFVPAGQLWVNPDCGLKTRNWPEVKEALSNMVTVAAELRSYKSKSIETP